MRRVACSLLALAAAIALSGQLTVGFPMKILREVAGETTYTFQTFETDWSGSVAELKGNFSKAMQVSIDRVHVLWNSLERDDSFDLHRFRNATSLPMLVLDFDFDFVKIAKPDGDEIVLVVEEPDTVADLKSKIEKRDNIPTHMQRLMRLDRVLDDAERLCGPASASNKNLTLVLKPSHVRVKLPGGELITFRVEPSEQVGSLKDRIQAEKGMAREQQSLLLNASVELQDDVPLLNSDITSDTILTLVQRQVSQGESTIVHVRLASAKLLTFDIDSSETVASLKDKISRAEGIPQSRQHLSLVPGKELADNTRLSERITKSECVLQLFTCDYNGQGAYHVHMIAPNGNEITNIPIIDVAPGDTVASIKSRIQTDTSIPQDHTVNLYSEGRALEEDRLMSEHVANNGSFVTLISRRRDGPQVIHVNLPSGRVITFNVPLSSQVSNLKNHIKRAYGTFPVDRQQIFFNNRELIEGRLDELNLVSGSTVSLILKPKVDSE